MSWSCILFLFTLLLLFPAWGCTSDADSPGEGPKTGPLDRSGIAAAMSKLRPLHRELGPPRPGDWLAEHHEEGQTFAEYVDCRPVRPEGKRRTICIVPLGEFTRTERRIITLTAEFMKLYVSVPVRVSDALPLSVIPEKARRVHPEWGVKQILSTHVLDSVLEPRLPDDALACIAFTASDLWPGEGWNFVFGQASLRRRVGVWSIFRNGDPDAGEAEFRLCLLRTMKTAVHEMGHMISMRHCILYECNMCGSNHRAESDRRPIALCPECAAKVWWCTGADPGERYRRLEAFCREHGFGREAEFYAGSIRALSGK